MAEAPGAPTVAWWRRRSPSVLVLLAIVAAMVLGTFVVGRTVAAVLDEVPKDRLGRDPWTATLGVARVDPFQIAHVPECAAGSITRIVLWDQDSNPIWEAVGPPTPMASFVVGGTPDGFTEVVKYEEPPRGALLRLVAFRRVGDPVGLRYRAVDLAEGRVVATPDLRRFSIEGFVGDEVCGDGGSTTPAGGSTPDDAGAPVDASTTSTAAGGDAGTDG